MRRLSLAHAVVAAFLVLCASATAVAGESVIEQDRERIREHLSDVEQRLRQRDVSHLKPALQRERERNLDRLHEYWKAGEFPHNTHQPGRVPVFIDRDGRECAVGYLMVESGWEDEAARISERENLAYLPDMQSPAVGEWVAQSGLTAEEAALIQPTYNNCNDGCDCENVDPVCGSDGRTYVNECFATNCAGVDAVTKGCCMVDATIQWAGNGNYGALSNVCSSDPNQDGMNHCPSAVGVPDAGSTDGKDAQSADTGLAPSGGGSGGSGGDSVKRGACSVSGAGRDLPIWGFCLVALGLWVRRRR